MAYSALCEWFTLEKSFPEGFSVPETEILHTENQNSIFCRNHQQQPFLYLDIRLIFRKPVADAKR